MIAPQQKQVKPPAQKSGGKLPMCAVALGLVMAVGVAAYLLMRPEEPVEQPAKATKRAERVTKAKSTVPSKPTPKVEQKIEAKDPSKMYEDGVEVVKYIVSTNNSGAVTEKLTLADGRKIAKVHPPKPVFDNPADQVIALAVSAKPGESMPPLPNLNGIDEDFAKSLLSPIKINDDDPDEVKELKAKVIETKAYLVEEIKNGGSVIEALKEHQAEMERIADSRLMAIREMQKLQSDGDPEMAREFAEKVNESFRARGIPEIPVPKK